METRTLYTVTSFSVQHDTSLGMFVVVNELDGIESYFDTLLDALDFADNGELSDEALAVLQQHR